MIVFLVLILVVMCISIQVVRYHVAIVVMEPVGTLWLLLFDRSLTTIRSLLPVVATVRCTHLAQITCVAGIWLYTCGQAGHQLSDVGFVVINRRVLSISIILRASFSG